MKSESLFRLMAVIAALHVFAFSFFFELRHCGYILAATLSATLIWGVEFFFHRLGRRGRVVADTLIRLVTMVLFSLFTWQFVHYGIGLRKSGEVSTTLQLPVFWVPHVMAFSCAIVVLVTLYHLLHPGKALLE